MFTKSVIPATFRNESTRKNMSEAEDFMIIKITNKHIINGEKGSTNKDPVAMAIKQAGYDSAEVYLLNINLIKNGVTTSVDTPHKVSQFILDFDEGREVMPFEFELL